MRKSILLLVLILFGAFAYGQGFLVRQLNVDIYLNSEGYFDVVENYDIDFLEQKHGIFRDIITDYKLQTFDDKTESRKLVIKNIEVPHHEFSINRPIEQRTEGKVSIKIGDKNAYVFGNHHYEIKYRVYNAFLFDETYAQFYWNIKPQNWLALFQQVNFTIHTPRDIPLSANNCFVYAGNSGVTELSQDFEYTYADGSFTAKSHESFYSVPGQDVTVLIKLPVDTIQANFITTPIWQKYGWIGILVGLLFGYWLVWLKYGKDDKVTATTSYYPPEDIDPALAGFLIDDKVDTSDLIALIPHWASQGFLTIDELPKNGRFSKADVQLTKLKTPAVDIPSYEQRIFSGLFGIWGNVVLISSLRDIFYITINQARKDLKTSAEKYYLPESKKVKKKTVIVAVILGIIICPVFLFLFSALAAVLGTITCVFIAFMCFFLEKKNEKGNAILSELLGFRQFIKVAEVNRIKMLIERDPKYFEKTMSYAMAFGLLDGWAEKFDALHIPPPSWYNNGAEIMSVSAFSHSFSNSIKIAQSSMVSAPSSSSSSGGGSSGGGFGGGGGGSW